MRQALVDVTAGGAVVLGQSGVVCDGFLVNYPYRVQTHTHLDHMQGFESSKGYQTILLTPETKALLVAQYNADLPYRCNIIEVPYGTAYEVDRSILTFWPSGHMLGAVQTCVETSDGLRIGYSGDFRWPLPSTISVDVLVVDSTYTSPSKEYGAPDVNARLVELVLDRISAGPVAIRGRGGTLHRAMGLLSEEISFPLLAKEDFVRQADVYRHYGHDLGRIYCAESALGRNVIASGVPFVYALRARDSSLDGVVTTIIDLGAHHSVDRDPVIEYSARSYGVALSDHATLDGVIEYVASTGAKTVITDNSRGGRAYQLAEEIRRRLDVPARPSSNRYDRSWGYA